MSATYFIYNSLLNTAALTLSPFWLYQLLSKKKLRTGFFQKLGFYAKYNYPQDKGTIWFHTVSVGEVNAAVPLIKEVKKRYPGRGIVVSTVTTTGNKTAMDKLAYVDGIVYFPFDFRVSVKKAITAISPAMCVILETELWPNYLRELKLRNIPSIILNGRISTKSYKRYKRLTYFMQEILNNITILGMQSPEDADKIIRLGADKERVFVCGNIKYERDFKIPDIEGINAIKKSIGMDSNSTLLVAGSTHPGEEKDILDIFAILTKKHHNLRLLIAPRHIERIDTLAQIVKEAGFNPFKKSGVPGKIPSLKTKSCDIILLDTIGELTSLYAVADIVFVGGSLIPHGGQNILEPAYFKKPVLFGKYMDNFKEIAAEMVESGGGIMVEGKEELLNHLHRMLSEPQIMIERGKNGYKVINKNRGALAKSIELINKGLNTK